VAEWHHHYSRFSLELGRIDEGEGKQQGRRPLWGGEGADREAAERGGMPALGREVAVAAC
jgi:hypothetical protein